MVAYCPLLKKRTSCLVSLVAWNVTALRVSPVEYTISPSLKKPANATLKAVSKLSMLILDASVVRLGSGCDVICVRISFVIGRRSESEGRLYSRLAPFKRRLRCSDEMRPAIAEAAPKTSPMTGDYEDKKVI